MNDLKLLYYHREGVYHRLIMGSMTIILPTYYYNLRVCVIFGVYPTALHSLAVYFAVIIIYSPLTLPLFIRDKMHYGFCLRKYSKL